MQELTALHPFHQANTQNHMHGSTHCKYYFELKCGVFGKFVQHLSKKPVHSRICETFHISMVGRSVGWSFVRSVYRILNDATFVANDDGGNELTQQRTATNGVRSISCTFMFFPMHRSHGLSIHQTKLVQKFCLTSACENYTLYSIDH